MVPGALALASGRSGDFALLLQDCLVRGAPQSCPMGLLCGGTPGKYKQASAATPEMGRDCVVECGDAHCESAY